MDVEVSPDVLTSSHGPHADMSEDTEEALEVEVAASAPVVTQNSDSTSEYPMNFPGAHFPRECPYGNDEIYHRFRTFPSTSPSSLSTSASIEIDTKSK